MGGRDAGTEVGAAAEVVAQTRVARHGRILGTCGRGMEMWVTAKSARCSGVLPKVSGAARLAAGLSLRRGGSLVGAVSLRSRCLAASFPARPAGGSPHLALCVLSVPAWLLRYAARCSVRSSHPACWRFKECLLPFFCIVKLRSVSAFCSVLSVYF